MNITIHELDNGKLFVNEDNQEFPPFQASSYKKLFNRLPNLIAPKKNNITHIRVECK